MTDERTLRDALRVEAEHEPVPADGWRQISAAIEADARRRRYRRLAGGVGAAVLAAAAAIGVGLVVTGDEQATVEVQSPDTTVPAVPTTTLPSPPTTFVSPNPAPTAGNGNTNGGSTPTTVPAPATTSPPETTAPPEPADPILAVAADGRVVTLSATDGTEITQLGAVALTDTAPAIGVSQANGVAYYSGPFQEEGPEYGRIWKVPVSGGVPELVGFGAHPAISPDGSTLAYVAASPSGMRNTIVLLDSATSQEISRTTWDPNDEDFFHLFGYISGLEWSPDGSALVFESSYEGTELYVFRPSGHPTLTEAEPVGGSDSPTWVGTDRIESVWQCCYPEYTEPREVRIYELGNTEPVATDPRPVVEVDRRPAGDRSAEIELDPNAEPSFPRPGRLILRDSAGAVRWETTELYIAVSA